MTQPLTIALLSPGAMGAAVGACLVAAGFSVSTSLEGRGSASVERARKAGMTPASDAELVRAHVLLSIVPPAEAMPLAERLLPLIANAERKPLYIDANALSPETKRAIAARLATVGCDLVDGAIIGPPPNSDGRATLLVLAGMRAAEAELLGVPGIATRVLDGPIGSAAALKMCYGAINKGVVGLAAAMMLAAERAGASDALREEMAAHMPDLFKRYQRQVPDMLPKAYRWVAEMREIAAFLADDPPAAAIYEGMAGVFEQIAADVAGSRNDAATLMRAISQDQG